jgi:hypothetical protein
MCNTVWRWCVTLCGNGFMDFIRRPESKILKIKITMFWRLALLPSSVEWRMTEATSV